VREEDGRDVYRPAAEEREAAVELRPVLGRAGVDDRHAAVVLDEVPVDELGAQPNDAVRDECRLGLPGEHAATLNGCCLGGCEGILPAARGSIPGRR
jgi:hypothetical protein